MSHQARGEPVPIYREGEYTAGAGGETIVPIHGPGATGTASRLRRSASVEHNPDSLAEKPPTGSRQPAFVHDDKFFNEKITLPRLAVNEREHITAEDYDNEDRGSLDNEEQYYDRSVKYSQSRSGSLPPRRFQEQRSSYFDWSGTAPRGQYYESRTQAHEGGQLANTPWNEFEERRQLQHRAEADQNQQFSKQTTHQTHERSHSEQHDFHRNYFGGGGHHRRERHSGEGGRGGHAYEEWHDGEGAVAPYYRPEHTSTLRGASSSKHQKQSAAAASAATHQQQQYAAGGASSYSHHRHHRSAASAGAGGGERYGHSQSWGYRAGGGTGGYYKDGGYYKEENRKYRKFYLCCFPCVCPPCAYEEAPPPRPMYYSKPPPPL